MPTPYELVFDAFTSKVKDKMFNDLPQLDAEDQMIQLLNDSLIFFKYPKIDIYDRNDVEKVFNQILSYHEIQIISQLMVDAWINRQINSIDVIKQKFTDRDFKLTSQAAHLETLLKLSDNQSVICNKLMKEYYKTSSRRPDYSNLAGNV
jgi:PBP1b-binding outer membrane lipoprotein LpoB